MATYRDAVTCQTASVSARSWARYADEHGHKSAMDVYQDAVKHSSWSGNAWLSSTSTAVGLTSDGDGNAAACAIRSRWYDKAVG